MITAVLAVSMTISGLMLAESPTPALTATQPDAIGLALAGGNAPTSPPISAEVSDSRRGTVALEVGAGMLAMAGGTALGTYIFNKAACADVSGDGRFLCFLGSSVLGLTTASLAMVPAAVWLAGGGTDGEGRLLGAFLGAVSGLAFDVGLAHLGQADNGWKYENTIDPVLLVTALVAPVAFSVIGYELSVTPKKTTAASTRVPVPFVAPLLHGAGGVVGLTGSF